MRGAVVARTEELSLRGAGIGRSCQLSFDSLRGAVIVIDIVKSCQCKETAVIAIELSLRGAVIRCEELSSRGAVVARSCHRT